MTTCIIPFYNEGKRILPVLKELTQIKEIHEIICVDDGSTDNTADLVKENYPNVKLISILKNSGKTEAISTGLKQAKDENILLIDADLRNLVGDEIKNAVIKMQNNPNIDMIVLRRIKAPFLMRAIRGNVLVSGERILEKIDLQKIIDELKPRGYQLEFAINNYMMKNNKAVYWMSSSALNTYPTMKLGILPGLVKSISMTTKILNYLGLINYIQQLLFFCRKRLT